MNKCHCQIIPTVSGPVNPHLKIALESLKAYEHWVSEVLMPIALQWIKDHEEEIHKIIPSRKHWDDIGVLVSAAFELVRKMDYYKEGLKIAGNPKKLKEFCVDCKSDVVWTAITKDARKCIKKAFAERKHILKYSVAE